jgi:hypothetical protein
MLFASNRSLQLEGWLPASRHDRSGFRRVTEHLSADFLKRSIWRSRPCTIGVPPLFFISLVAAVGLSEVIRRFVLSLDV